MKKISVLAAAALLVALASSNCFAINAGQTQVNLAGSISSSKPDGGGSTTSTMITTGVGYFLRDNVSVGAAVFVNYSKPDGLDATLANVINAQAKYHFMPKNTIVPYVGVQAGYMGYESGGNTGSGYDIGAMGGADFFITENAAFNVELNVRQDSFSAGGSTTKQTTTALLFGLSYFFGK